MLYKGITKKRIRAPVQRLVLILPVEERNLDIGVDGGQDCPLQLELVLLALLDKMIKFAKVLIVTNAKEGWVEYSSYYLLPRVHQLIETYVPVVSA